jgi:cell division protein FtsB
MLDKIKNSPYVQYAKELRDVRVLGLLAFVVIILLVSWSGIKSIQTNYELQQKIARLEQEVEVKELENANAELRNQYLETDQFLELAARRQFGKAAPGEKLVLVPEAVALANSIPTEESEKPKPQPQAKKSEYQRNFEAWMQFFFNSSS